MGDLDLPNRIVMAPLTRMRAGPIDHVPTALQAESVFVSSDGELPRNFVDGPIIWKGV
jgi:2,4-dienoyl-CoA reductase-like NADH-dependent reductase (Old Yellow Enzyme family)